MFTCFLRPIRFSLLCLFLVGRLAGDNESRASDDRPQGTAAPHRILAASRFSIDEMLKRPYGPDVPMGCVGDRVWASSPQGWGFRDDVHWLYLTNLNAFDIEIRDTHGLLQPAKATYYPSHVHVEGAVRALTASASFTFTIDNVEHPLSKPFRPEKRWTCWSSGKREDWYAVDFGATRRLGGVRVFFFDDAPTGGCRPPERFEVQHATDSAWESVTVTRALPEQPGKGENVIEFEPVDTNRVRLVFRHRGDNFYTGLYGFEPIVPTDTRTKPDVPPIHIHVDKFVTSDDVLVSHVTLTPSSDSAVQLTVRLKCPRVLPDDRRTAFALRRTPAGRETWHAADTAVVHDQAVHFQFGFRLMGARLKELTEAGAASFVATLAPEESASLCVAFAIDPRSDVALQALERWLAFDDPITNQQREYQAWFDTNLAYFDCSDPWVTKMYYHRAYNLRKNLLDPKLGRMQWRTQSEGRWRSGWYANVISYGGGHQVREARWLRDPSYAQGHLRTFTENQKSDGIYPSHVRPNGPQGGQYTDWITSSAWDAYLVHPDREFLAAVADKLADNVRGWQRVYDPDGDGLLLVDSHWWTGMEYQPSFFFFSHFRPAKDFLEPENRVSLDRVDLTAYNFGNAAAVARIYREIGRPEKAQEFDDLAAKIAAALQTKMWDANDRFFYSLKHDDGAKAEVKEVVGVYPFYFGMLPIGDNAGYEAAWESILDPAQFWTAWPVASASKQCPAYSQTNWPLDGRSAGCMWNGPTWPHANSIVMTGMARTIRQSRGPSIKNQKPKIENRRLWDLFYSFTRAQYRDQDLTYPWTGEYYDGETARWKTAERDYNHSTWIDVLIPDVIGLVPRADDTLEIDPLVPADRLSHFLLDGQHYRGHDVTIVWDAPEGSDNYADARKGLDVYLDGRLVASSPSLARLLVDLKTGERLH